MNALYMIRHSITEANLRRLYYGATDVPLCEEGHALCRSLRGSYTLPADVSFACTGLSRTSETLRDLFGDVPFDVLPQLQEMRQGKFEMRCYDELKDDPDYQAWLNDQTGSFVIPGGESNAQFADRVVGCIRELGRTRDGSLFVVSHGGAIASAMHNLFRDETRTFYDWIVHACEGYVIFFRDGEPVSWERIPLVKPER